MSPPHPGFLSIGLAYVFPHIYKIYMQSYKTRTLPQSSKSCPRQPTTVALVFGGLV